MWDLPRQTLSQLTFDPAADFAPAWTPDGRRLVFFSQRGREPGVFWQLADGTGTAERLTTSAPTSAVTPDGTHALLALTGNQDLAMVSLDGTPRAVAIEPSLHRAQRHRLTGRPVAGLRIRQLGEVQSMSGRFPTWTRDNGWSRPPVALGRSGPRTAESCSMWHLAAPSWRVGSIRAMARGARRDQRKSSMADMRPKVCATAGAMTCHPMGAFPHDQAG